MLPKFKKELSGGAVSCRQSLGYKKQRDQGQETSGFRHSIFFGAHANNIKQARITPKKDFKQWLYPSPGESIFLGEPYKLFSFMLFMNNNLSELIWATVRQKSPLLANELSEAQTKFACQATGATFIDSQRRPGQGCAGFSLVFFKQGRANSEPEAARSLLQERKVEAEHWMESKMEAP